MARNYLVDEVGLLQYEFQNSHGLGFLRVLRLDLDSEGGTPTSSKEQSKPNLIFDAATKYVVNYASS